MYRALFPVIFILVAAHASAEDKIWTLRGRVLDQQDRAVSDVSVTTVWTANGVTLEQFRRFENDGKPHPEMSKNEGRMEPWGKAPTKTGADGNFSIELRSSRDSKLMAIDKERKRGGLIIVDPRSPPASIECKLVPLVRLHGNVRLATTGEPTRDVTVVVGLPVDENFPLGRRRLAICSSTKSQFEFWLPPGEYRFEAFGHDPANFELTESPAIRLEAGQRDVDCGFLDLVQVPKNGFAVAKQSGTWRDFTQRYGEQCPAWHAIDARGMSNVAQAADFRGKWILIYFWGTSCAPCLEKGIPKIRDFYEAQVARRDRFEVVSICTDFDGKIQTMADLDRELKPVVKAVWDGKAIPFPVLLDNSYKSMENFGVEFLGATLLIDPTGRLVQGDELTLGAILEDGERLKSR